MSEASANQQFVQANGVVNFDTETGMGRFKAVYVNVVFDEDKKVAAFVISDNYGNEAIICEDMSLKVD